MALVRPTEMRRVTLTREARVVIPSFPLYRRVILTTPGGQIGAFALDTKIQTPATNNLSQGPEYDPDGINPNDVFRLCELPQQSVLFFWLYPEQFLIGASKGQTITCTAIIEYYDTPPSG